MQIKKIRVKSDVSFPVWSIVHYLNRLSINYLKLLTIERVCEALADGCLDQDLVVAEQSAALMSTTPFLYDSNIKYKTLVNKGDDYKEFWNIIKVHHRPIVFRRFGNNFVPIIDIRNDDLIINKLTVTSPPDITISGAGSILSDIIYAGEREKRRRDAHQNAQIGQVAYNIGQIALAQALINNPNLGAGFKEYLGGMILDLLDKQAQLTVEMGLTSVRLDETV